VTKNYRLRRIRLVRIRVGLLQVLLDRLCPWRHVSSHSSLPLRFKRVSSLPPGIEAALQRAHVGPAGIEKRLRHTGARFLVRSSAVGDDGTIAWDVCQQSIDLVRGNAQRTGDLHVGLLPDRWCAGIEQRDRLVGVKPAPQLVNSNDWNSN
jgi:hypothetical protein